MPVIKLTTMLCKTKADDHVMKEMEYVKYKNAFK